MKQDLLFEFLNSINYTKQDIMTQDNEKQFNSYVINHFLSGNLDAVMQANQMNMFYFLDNRLKYDYLRNSIRKRKRYSKWLKKDKIIDLKLVQEYFGYNIEKAKECLRILSQEQLNYIKDVLNSKKGIR